MANTSFTAKKDIFFQLSLTYLNTKFKYEISSLAMSILNSFKYLPLHFFKYTENSCAYIIPSPLEYNPSSF